MAKLCRIEHAIGEDRAAVIAHKRDVEYFLRRWSDTGLARKGEIFSGRVIRIDKDLMAAFIDLGTFEIGKSEIGKSENGKSKNGLLRFSMAPGLPRLVEGDMVRVEVLRQAEQGKGPLLKYTGPSDATKPCKEKIVDLRTEISSRYANIKFEESPVNGIDKAAETEIALSGGGFVYIEHTRAGTMIDVDTGTGKKGLVGIRAAREIGRQIRGRGIGGLILIDFPNFRKKKVQADVWQTLKDGFNDDLDMPKVAPFSRFGTVEMTRTRRGPSVAQIMCDQNGSATSETCALRALRRLESEARLDGGARLVLQLPTLAYEWLMADHIDWRKSLEARIGARFRIMAGANIDVFKDET